MKHISLKKIVSIISLSSSLLIASAPAITPLISMRSQGQDLARYLSGISQYIDINDMDCVYGNFAITTEYTQSFSSKQMAQCLFGPQYTCNLNCPAATIPISGSRVANRGATDWLADYFYLPTDFQSTVN